MPTTDTIFTNYATLRCEGMVDLSAAGAVSTYRGDGIVVTKNGIGLYDVVVDNPSELRLVEVLGVGAHLIDATIGTVKDVGIEATVTQSSTTGKFAFTVHTVDGLGADVDEATSVLSVAFYFVIRTGKMTSTL